MKPVSKPDVQVALRRCDKRRQAAINSYIRGEISIYECNDLFERWNEASICLMRLFPEDFLTADLS